MSNPFSKSENDRKRIVSNQQKKIKQIYIDCYNDIHKEVEKLKGKNDKVSTVKRVYLNKLEKDLIESMKVVDKKTEVLINENVKLMSNSVFDTNMKYLKGIGINLNVGNKKLKLNIVNDIVNGKFYNGKWSLSSAIWGDNKIKQREIRSIISKGLLKNKSVYEIGKDLERYVNPRSRKKYSWSNMFPGSRKKIDYNAQRLARTVVSHAYEQSFVKSTIKNPFIGAYRWVTSGGDKVCVLCLDREMSDHYGLGHGIFPKDKLPLDHPNGMCTFEPVMLYDDEEIAELVADWYLDEGDVEMNEKINLFIEDLNNF